MIFNKLFDIRMRFSGPNETSGARVWYYPPKWFGHGPIVVSYDYAIRDLAEQLYKALEEIGEAEKVIGVVDDDDLDGVLILSGPVDWDELENALKYPTYFREEVVVW